MGLDSTGFDVDLDRNGGLLVRESIPGRFTGLTDLATALSSGVLLNVSIPALAGDLLGTVSFQSGATACVTPANWWFALYDDQGVLLAQTADQLTAAWAANTKMSLALTAPQLIQRPGIIRAALMVNAATPPSIVGTDVFHANLSSGLVAGQKALAQTSGSALTGTAPTSIATPTTVKTVPYCALSA